jgi:DNA-binding XRE family transcriptional regulator
MQLRMARAGLELTMRQVAELASVNVNTVTRIENRHPALYDTVQKIRTALKAAGAEFIGGDGVQLHRRWGPAMVYRWPISHGPAIPTWDASTSAVTAAVRYALATLATDAIGDACRSPVDPPSWQGKARFLVRWKTV